MLYFKLPFFENIYTIDGNSNQNPVSFFSFDKSEILNFEGNTKEISLNEFLNHEIFTHSLPTELLEFQEETQVEYQHKLENVIEFIKENELSKLVISRRKFLNFNDSGINLSQTFFNLCKSYPNAFVYFFIKNGKCWMGAFSEVLGDFNKETCGFKTMSLAGTLPLNEDWTAKEIEEQKPVTEFIANTLEKYSSSVEQSETYDHISGNIKHLRTDFKSRIDPEKLEKLIENLHPTPAVCGIPKDSCKNAIEKFEKFPRDFYAGYIKVETPESIKYFVNLRCAEFLRNAAFIHVGGGITPESSPEKEWQETELKADAILKNLVFI